MLGQRVYLSYSKTVKWITAGMLGVSVVIFIQLALEGCELIAHYSQRPLTAALLGLALLCYLFILVYYMMQAPRYYMIDRMGLTLKLLVGQKFYPAGEYEIDSEGDFSSEVKQGFRLWGSGGYFGFVGKFRVPQKGTCQFYLSNNSGNLIRLRNKQTGKYTYISKS